MQIFIYYILDYIILMLAELVEKSANLGIRGNFQTHTSNAKDASKTMVNCN